MSALAFLLVPVLLAAPEEVPDRTKGLQVLWVPESVTLTSNTVPGFKFRHPASREDMVFRNAAGLKKVLEKLPALTRANGIWISTTNDFLYSAEENLELRNLVAIARSLGIPVFRAELGEQPHGWKKAEE